VLQGHLVHSANVDPAKLDRGSLFGILSAGKIDEHDSILGALASTLECENHEKREPVHLHASSAIGTTESCDSLLRGEAFTVQQTDATRTTRFAVGETKQCILDFHNVPGQYRYELGPGTWTFHGQYRRVWAPSSPTVTVGP
jgi:hypothetical protein